MRTEDKGVDVIRCPWVLPDPLSQAYHDREWGVPVRDDRHLFELLILEGAQAGLNWNTVLRKRDMYREAFDGFDAEKVAAYGQDQIQRLLAHPGIIRNRLKVRSAVQNARAFLEVKAQWGSFARYLWSFVDGRPVIHHFRERDQVPTVTPLSEQISRDLKSRGFSFVGPTICYSFLQASGVVMDHVVPCFRYTDLAGDRC